MSLHQFPAPLKRTLHSSKSYVQNDSLPHQVHVPCSSILPDHFEPNYHEQ